jgi:hypothetical protein
MPFPGAVVEGRRSIWQLGQVQVSDGKVSTTGDNTLYLNEGEFVP